MYKKMKSVFLAVLIFVMLFSMTGCGNANNSAENTGDGSNSGNSKELVIAIPEEIEGTDIQQVKWENIVHSLLFQPFVTYDLDVKKLVSAAAVSCETSSDGKELTFKFPEGAKFADGNPMTAEEVKNSMLRYKEISPYSSDFDPIKEFVVKDPQTLVLKLENSAAYLWPVLASTYGGVVDPKKAQGVSKEVFNQSAVGNGPYTVGEWVQGSQITLVKNPDFKTNSPLAENKGAFSFDKIIIRFIPENFTRVSEIESGNVDIIYNVPAESLDSLKANKDIKVYQYTKAGMDHIAINTRKEPLNDVNVRKAITLAINKDELSSSLNSTVVPKYGLISEAMLCYDENTENQLKSQLSFNIDKAKSLLQESGWKDENGDGIVEKNGKPLELTMMVALDIPALKQSAPLIQSQLKQAGIKLDLREYDSKYIKQMVKEKNFDLAMRIFQWSDPDIFTYYFGSESGYPWSNPEVNKMIDDARYIMDMNERTKKYSEMQLKMMSDVPVIPLFAGYEYTAVKSSIDGIKVGVDGRMFLNDAIKK